MDSILEFELKSYDTTHPNRGIAVVINDSERREGSEKDVQDVEATLEGLKFNVRTFRDNTKKEIKKALYKVAREDHTENDCLVIVAMAHGTKDHITLKKEKLRIDKLWASFVGNKCPSLIGKPKLVFIQTCRGDKVDFGVASHETDSTPCSVDPAPGIIPMYADLLVMYSSYDRHISVRCKDKGSWFIQSLCQVLRANIAGKELISLLTQVSYIVSCQTSITSDGETVKQIPSINSMLTKAFYFVQKKNSADKLKAVKHLENK